MAAGRTPASISSLRTTDSLLNDLVSYNEKHNEANGENNHDGDNNNHIVESAAQKGRPTIQRSTHCAKDSAAIS